MLCNLPTFHLKTSSRRLLPWITASAKDLYDQVPWNPRCRSVLRVWQDLGLAWVGFEEGLGFPAKGMVKTQWFPSKGQTHRRAEKRPGSKEKTEGICFLASFHLVRVVEIWVSSPLVSSTDGHQYVPKCFLFCREHALRPNPPMLLYDAKWWLFFPGFNRPRFVWWPHVGAWIWRFTATLRRDSDEEKGEGRRQRGTEYWRPLSSVLSDIPSEPQL